MLYSPVLAAGFCMRTSLQFSEAEQTWTDKPKDT